MSWEVWEGLVVRTMVENIPDALGIDCDVSNADVGGPEETVGEAGLYGRTARSELAQAIKMGWAQKERGPWSKWTFQPAF